jgi:hypothetical protein
VRRIKALLSLLRSRFAKEPHDKVLAVFGTAHDNNTAFVFPDYRHPVRNLYVAAVKYWISDKHLDLDFLSQVQETEPAHKLPSWVPDWSCASICAPLISIGDSMLQGIPQPM